MINPMSGEGIFYGMEAGYLLAKDTFELLDNNIDKLNFGIKNYENRFNKRFGKHFLSCSLARLVFQSPFMTKRLLAIASADQHTIDFVVELYHISPSIPDEGVWNFSRRRTITEISSEILYGCNALYSF